MSALTSRSRRQPSSGCTDDGRLWLLLMLTLTFSTGIVDAVGFLGLDRVFTGNMTGNVAILGMAATGADDLPVLGPLLALAGFLLGAAVGGRALRTSSRWSVRTTACLGAAAATTLAVGAVAAAAGEPSQPTAVTLTTLLGAVMGVQASAARSVAVADVTTVVVTSTLTALASESRLAGGSAPRSGRRIAAVLAILLGAALGAALLHVGVGAGLLVAGTLMTAVVLVGAVLARRVEAAEPIRPPTPTERGTR